MEILNVIGKFVEKIPKPLYVVYLFFHYYLCFFPKVL